jgi:hypothetical protein
VSSCGSVDVELDVDTAVVVLVVVTDTIDVEVVVGGGHAPRWRQVPPTAQASVVHESPSLQMTPYPTRHSPSEQLPVKEQPSCKPVHAVPFATAVYSHRDALHASTVHSSPSSQSASSVQGGRSMRNMPLLGEPPLSVA